MWVAAEKVSKTKECKRQIVSINFKFNVAFSSVQVGVINVKLN